jgi:hypothetical protein
MYRANVTGFAAAVLLLTPAWAGSSPETDAAQEVLTLERQAMDGWLAGNPDPQLAVTDRQITYIHAVAGQRLEGIDAVREMFERYRGRPLFDSYEILEPIVQSSGDIAILTYQLERHNGAATSYWHGTQVYQRKPEGWRVIHTHWSAVQR